MQITRPHVPESLLIDSFWHRTADQLLKSRVVAQGIPGGIESQLRLCYGTWRIWNREEMFESGNGGVGFANLRFGASEEFFDTWRHNRIVDRGDHGKRTLAFTQSGFFVAETGIS